MEKRDGVENLPLIYDQGSITLPFNEENLKDFITTLFGKPELIEGYVEGAYEIDFSTVKNINYQIDNKLCGQNDAWLVEFNARLNFDDNSSISFNNIDALEKFEDIRQITCTGFFLTWVYMVRFNSDRPPQRQEISIFTFEESTSRKQKGVKALEDVSLPRINYSIRHSVRSWGLDIAELLKNILLLSIKPKGVLFDFRKSLIENITNIAILIVLAISLIAVPYFINTYNIHYLPDISIVLGDQVSIGEKIDLLMKYTVAQSDVSFFKFSLVFIPTVGVNIFAGVALFFVYQLIKLPKYKFLVFNQFSEQEKDKFFSRDQKLWWFSIFGLLANIGAGIAANYIFQMLSYK